METMKTMETMENVTRNSSREHSLGKTVRGLENHYDAPLDHVVLIGWKFT